MNPAQSADISGPYTARVSVVVPAYNKTPYIVETLESVFSQTFPPHQVIVVNDGSPDTPELEVVLAPYRDRITYIVQENRGISGARNTGLRAATGNLVALLDGDDLWMPGYLEEQVAFFQQHPEFDLIYCNARFFGASIHDGVEYMKVCPSEGEADAKAIISRRCHVLTSSVIARTQALAAIGFDETLRYCEDFDCWLRLTAAGYKIGYHRKILVRYRKYADSLSANSDRMDENSLKVLTKSLQLWPQGSEEVRLLKNARALRQAQRETTRAKLALRNNDIPAALMSFDAANSFYKRGKISAVIILLRLVPGLVRGVTKLRAKLSPAHRSI